MSSTPNPPPHLHRVLGLPALVLFGLAYMVPLTVFTTYGVVTDSTAGHLPGAYVLTLAAMLFTAYSYGRMVVVHPYAGSAYTYTQKSFGSHAGFLVGWALLLDYIFLPMINYLVIGIYLNAQFPSVAQPLWIVGAIVLVTALNVIGIRLVTRMNLVLVAFQIVFLAVFAVAAVRSIATDARVAERAVLRWHPHYAALFAGAAILCLFVPRLRRHLHAVRGDPQPAAHDPAGDHADNRHRRRHVHRRFLHGAPGVSPTTPRSPTPTPPPSTS